MQAIQFQAVAQDGIIKIPDRYRARVTGSMQVIVLFTGQTQNTLQAARQLAALGGSEKQLADIARRREF